MHAPIERKAVGIQREPQRLRFRPPEPFGEPVEQGTARLRQARLGLEELARRICDQTGLKMPKEPPVGLRGKYYPDIFESPEEPQPRLAGRFNLQIPTRKASRLTNYRWHDYGPFNPERKVTPIQIDVAPTTLEFLPVWRGRGGYPLPPMPFPRRLPSQAFTLLPPLPRMFVFPGGSSLYFGYRLRADGTLEHVPPQVAIPCDPTKSWLGPIDSRNRKDAQFFTVPWMRYDYRQSDGPPVRENEHDFMERWGWRLPRIDKRVWPDWMLNWRELPRFWFRVAWPPLWLRPYFTARPASEVGFTLVQIGVCECTRRDYPVSTYVPERRAKPGGRVGQSIADDDNWIVEAFENRPWDDPEPDIRGIRPWDDDAGPEVVEFVQLEEVASLPRDMSTRYAWQVPKDIPYSRIEDSERGDLWRAFSVRTFLTAPQVHKRGRPTAGEDRSGLLADWFDHYDLWLTDRRLKQRGYPNAERLAMLSSAYKISAAKVKRVRDAVRAEMLKVLNRK
jgi:hypothetical protein